MEYKYSQASGMLPGIDNPCRKEGWERRMVLMFQMFARSSGKHFDGSWKVQK